VFGYGHPSAPVLIIGEAPGGHEDECGNPFVGDAGLLLDQYLAMVSANPEVRAVAGDKENFNPKLLRDLLRNEYFFTNIAACHPPENRDPNLKEIEACMPRVRELIYLIDPVIILAVGKIALTSLTGKKALSITQVRGNLFDIEIPGRTVPLHYTVMALLHTSYLCRMNDFKQDTSLGAKTYEDFMRAHRILDEYNKHHFGIDIPKRGIPRGQ
jgi:DNA polymerase